MLAAQFIPEAAMSNSPESLQLNLGVLRAPMSLTLHTHHASRIWHGRATTEERPGIVGLNGFVSIMNKLKRGVEQDDPYSDGWMLRIEEKLEQTSAVLHIVREQADQALAGVPSALSLGENLNVQPVKLPLFINSQLGFKAVYLLADFDELARRLILAHHTAMIDRNTLERWLDDGAHALRSLFSLAQHYRYSGATRADFAAMNAVARNAIEKFGELPQEIFDGTRRSRFSPPIARRPASGRAESDKGDAEQPKGEEFGTATGEGEAKVEAPATDNPAAADGAPT
jgi:integrating conjugative element protein (TIGR03761 family)